MSVTYPGSARHGPWTAADQGELDVLVNALVREVAKHRETCLACKREEASGVKCKAVSEAIDALLEWQKARALLSFALWIGSELVEHE